MIQLSTILPMLMPRSLLRFCCGIITGCTLLTLDAVAETIYIGDEIVVDGYTDLSEEDEIRFTDDFFDYPDSWPLQLRLPAYSFLKEEGFGCITFEEDGLTRTAYKAVIVTDNKTEDLTSYFRILLEDPEFALERKPQGRFMGLWFIETSTGIPTIKIRIYSDKLGNTEYRLVTVLYIVPLE